jgi:hypothetical protein
VETDVQLASFRKQRDRAERTVTSDSTPVEEVTAEWSVSSKKRKQAPEKGLVKGLKLRKISSEEDKSNMGREEPAKIEASVKISSSTSTKSTEAKPKTSSTSALGLSAYSSDEE